MSTARTRAAVVVGAVVLSSAAPSEGQSCPVPGYEIVAPSGNVSGAATVDLGAGATTSDGTSTFAFGSHDQAYWSPVGRGDAVDFAFELQQEARPVASIACDRASFAALSAGQPVPLAQLCGVTPLDAGSAGPSARLEVRGSYADASTAGNARPIVYVFDLSHVQGTATMHPALDARGNGTVDLELDAPEASLTSIGAVDPDSGQPVTTAQPATVRFSATALNGTATFADSTAVACPSSGGGCDCGPGHFWRPGGD